MVETNGYRAVTKFLVASPTKVRPVANVIKRKTCSEAMAILENMPQKGANLSAVPLNRRYPMPFR